MCTFLHVPAKSAVMTDAVVRVGIAPVQILGKRFVRMGPVESRAKMGIMHVVASALITTGPPIVETLAVHVRFQLVAQRSVTGFSAWKCALPNIIRATVFVCPIRRQCIAAHRANLAPRAHLQPQHAMGRTVDLPANLVI